MRTGSAGGASLFSRKDEQHGETLVGKFRRRRSRAVRLYEQLVFPHEMESTGYETVQVHPSLPSLRAKTARQTLVEASPTVCGKATRAIDTVGRSGQA